MVFSRRFRFRYFLLASLLIHLFSGSVVLWRSWETPLPAPTTVQLEIVESTPPQELPPAPTRQRRIEPLKNQIVDQADRALNDEVPDDARFLSKNNQVVKKQTVSQHRGEFRNKAEKAAETGNNGTLKNPSLIDLKPKFDVAKAVQDRIEKENAFEKSAADGTLPPAAAKKAAAAQDLAGGAAKGAEASQTLDYIKDLDPGLETLLSTKEFVYYSYFNRIRNQLNQHWTDKVRSKISEMYKKGRSIASSDDKVTKCLITLDTAGKLLKIQIIGISGVHELDEAAVEAFRAAAPFPNPPKGMIDPDGTIKIRWDFILEA